MFDPDALKNTEPEPKTEEPRVEPGQGSKEKGFEDIFAKLSEEELKSHLQGIDKYIEEAEQYIEVRKQQAIEEGNREVERRKKIKEALQNLLAEKERQKK